MNTQARFPTKLGEYLASGAPVVASARGELLGYLTDGESAFLAGPGGAEEFGRRVVDALRNPSAAREVGRKGREVAVREFDYRRYGGVLYDWFRDLTKR